ncbi:hypothetical protein ACLOJK_041065 [Asimina triloba]
MATTAMANTPLSSAADANSRSWDGPPKTRDKKCILHLAIRTHLPHLLQEAWAMNPSTSFTSISTARNPTCMPRSTHLRPESLPSLHGTSTTTGSQRPAFKPSSTARQQQCVLRIYKRLAIGQQPEDRTILERSIPWVASERVEERVSCSGGPTSGQAGQLGPIRARWARRAICLKAFMENLLIEVYNKQTKTVEEFIHAKFGETNGFLKKTDDDVEELSKQLKDAEILSHITPEDKDDHVSVLIYKEEQKKIRTVNLTEDIYGVKEGGKTSKDISGIVLASIDYWKKNKT